MRDPITPLSLEAVRTVLESTAAAHGLTLDFLMRTWNGRFATYNVGVPTEFIGDHRQGVRGDARHYRLLGRVKANTRAEGLMLTLNPPTACDVTPTPEEQALWDAFVADVLVRVS